MRFSALQLPITSSAIASRLIGSAGFAWASVYGASVADDSSGESISAAKNATASVVSIARRPIVLLPRRGTDGSLAGPRRTVPANLGASYYYLNPLLFFLFLV